MKLRDFKIGWRLLVKEPAYSALVIFGLSFGFAACFLLLSYVRYSLSYESHIPDVQRIFLVTHRLNVLSRPTWLDLTPMPFKTAAEKSGIPLTATAVFTSENSVRIDTKVLTLEQNPWT